MPWGGAGPEAVTHALLSGPPGSAPVCSPQQYKDCADPTLGKGKLPASRPRLAGPGTPTPQGRQP